MTVFRAHLSPKHTMVSSRSLCVSACFATMALMKSLIQAQSFKAAMPKMNMSKETKWLVSFALTRSSSRMGRIISLMARHLRSWHTCYVPHVCHGRTLTRLCIWKSQVTNDLQAADVLRNLLLPGTIAHSHIVGVKRHQFLCAQVFYQTGILPNCLRFQRTSKRICQTTRGM